MTANHPNKHLVRQYTQDRAKSKEPPPSPERIKELLGWEMLEAEQEPKLQQR